MAPEATDNSGSNVNAADGQQLTPAQEAAIERIKKTKGGVSAGRALFDQKHPRAAQRREGRNA